MIQDILANNDNIHANDKQMAILKEHFPACFSKDGAFDIERFKEEIKDKTDITTEGYELKFLGKSYAKLLASTETTTVIVPDEEHNQKPENKNSENIYISGDNLDGLKHLLHSYQKKIKCIYIDPPYNTGSDGFVYNDSFNYTSEELQEKLSIGEKEAQRILDLTKRGSASHSAWLMFMYPRLLLARDLMTDDGVIFISIDDNEQANLKLLCDDIFGEENFVGQWNWFKSATPPNLSKKIKKNIEYVLCYQLKENQLIFKGESKFSKSDDPITKLQNSIKTLTFKPHSIHTNIEDSTIPSGEYGTEKFPNILLNDLIIKNGTNQNEVSFSNRFIWLQNKLDDELDRGTTIKLSKSLVISYKKKNYNAEVPPNFINKDVGVDTTENAGRYLTSLFDEIKVFDYPKPLSLIKYLTNFLIETGDTILDFFSGSATTAHAVMQLNAEDASTGSAGQRKFIAVQLPEVLSDRDDSQKNAYKFLQENGYPTTLDYIGIERIKRAAAKIKEEQLAKGVSLSQIEALDLGFKHFTLKEPEQNTLDKLESFNKSALIADTTVLDDFGTETVLATWLNDDGYGLTATAEETDLEGYKAYYKDKHLYFIYPHFTQEALQALITRFDTDGSFNPENIVLFGYSFSDWSVNEMLEKNLKILNDSEKNLKINYAVRY